jgi:arylsulfatase A-like enzyme
MPSLFGSALALVTLAAGAEAERPNVVVILADDQGWGDLSLNGNRSVRTPNIDSLAMSGARCERFFVQPVCSPTRAEFLTGRWHPRGGVSGVSTGAERLDLDEATIADAFHAAGYATGCFGKWHNGSQHPYHPNSRGFAEYFGFASGHWGEYFNAPLDHNGMTARGRGYLVDELTDRAITFISANAAAERPSFCYLALNTPHSPMQVPDEYWRRFAGAPVTPSGERGENLDHTHAALAMCENIDQNVGRLLAALREKGIERETIVVYFSDNGPNGPRWNGGMKGRKGTVDEGGVRSPLLVRWPEKVKPYTVVSPIAAAVDLLPTLLELAGVARVGTKPLDGISLAPLLLGEKKPVPDRILFQHWAGRTSARSQRFRLDPTGRLFDMEADPGQKQDIAAAHPAEAKRLGEAVSQWKREVLAELPVQDARPFTIGGFVRTVLPARDGVPHGGVKRSAPAPNCSFFTNWTTLDGRMTWDVETLVAGRYEAIVHYTCSAADVGSTFELSLGTTKWTGEIQEPHDPPLRGMMEDRTPRKGESYVKDFRPLSLGTAALASGRETLTLRATRTSGKQVADVRAVELIKKD